MKPLNSARESKIRQVDIKVRRVQQLIRDTFEEIVEPNNMVRPFYKVSSGCYLRTSYLYL